MPAGAAAARCLAQGSGLNDDGGARLGGFFVELLLAPPRSFLAYVTLADLRLPDDAALLVHYWADLELRKVVEVEVIRVEVISICVL